MSQTVVVTGANKGIGFEFCAYYKQKGFDVIAVCRSASEELQGLGVEIIDGVDVSTDQGIERLKQAIGGRSIDILINNAGIFSNQSLNDMDFSEVSRQLEVNAVGPLKVTHALLGGLKSGTKVALVTSRMGSISDNTSGAYYGYRMSKAALNAAGMSLANDLKPQGVAIAILHPGFVQTSMVGYAGDISPATAAERLAQRIAELTIETTGTFWHSNGDVLPW
ncbi:SDR family oxidoreductase [Alkalimarinus sediminis]|uniref:SDR family oxidoreductase n=1 Tax=Alkalimarinus sediminis TaxID=1632866 RepID=A0A9E8HIT9_9ALTE|nr:SDR family oxidoreductase [Alkalimarinus sediminis]UZW75160.1 SDR family oxidoreductase [Alkalimarinus sediminis]